MRWWWVELARLIPPNRKSILRLLNFAEGLANLLISKAQGQKYEWSQRKPISETVCDTLQNYEIIILKTIFHPND